ncbi:hypothetical protein GCM10020000_04520 [Streptomyces olivoverticillatus]
MPDGFATTADAYRECGWMPWATGSPGNACAARWMSLRRLMSATAVPEQDDTLVPATPPVPLREVFRRFWPYTRGGWRWLLPLLAFVVAGPVTDAAGIWLFKILIDDVLVPRRLGLFLPLALAYAGLTVLAGAVRFGDDMISAWVSERFLMALRSDLFRHLQSLSLGFFERRRLGDVLSRLTGDVESVETFLLSGLVSTVSHVIELIVFLTVLFALSWDLTLVALLVTPLFWITARRFSRLVRAASRERRRRSGTISAVAEETLGSIALVQAYHRQDQEQQRFQAENLGRYRAELAAKVKLLDLSIACLPEGRRAVRPPE